MIPLTDNENKFYEEQKECHICQKEFCYDKNEKKKFKIYQKVRDHCHYTGKFRGAAHSICNLNYKVPQEIPVKIHNGSKYDYHFIIRELAEEFKGQFECLGENTEKYITFSILIKKENDNGTIIKHKIKFIDTCRFMQSKLSDLVDNLSEKFPSVYQFCNGDLNKFVLLLRKGVYPYEYMDSWERFNETSLPPKKSFYSELNLEDISDKDYLHAQKVWDVFEIRNLGEYHDLYVQTDTSLLADVFEKFRDTCIEIYGLDPSHFLSAPGLAWQACLKKQM